MKKTALIVPRIQGKGPAKIWLLGQNLDCLTEHHGSDG